MKPLLLLAIAGTLCGQSFPSGVATDSELKLGINNLATKLTLAMGTGDTLMTVADTSRITPNILLTIETEVVSVTSVAGNVLTVQRGFDNTTATTHAAGKPVTAYITAYHHNQVSKNIKAIETALGANLVNITNPPVSSGIYAFTVTPGGTLTAGVLNVVTLTACPRGVNGTDIGHAVYLSGGTGAAETAVIQGGTCAAGGGPGTINIQPVNAHSGLWTITSATGGIQEAACTLPPAGGTVNVNTPVALLANVTDCGKTSVTAKVDPGATLTGSFTIFNSQYAASSATGQVLSNATTAMVVAHNLSNDDASNHIALAGESNPNDFTTDMVHDFHGQVTYHVGVLGQQSTPAVNAFSFANLGIASGSTKIGNVVYCLDCQLTNPCTSGGPGATARYLGGGSFNCISPLEVDGLFSNVSVASASHNGVGAGIHVRASGDGVDATHPIYLWGINTLQTDQNTGTNAGHNHVYITNEWDFNVNGPDTKVVAHSIGGASTTQPTSALGYIVNGLGTLASGIKWTTGFACLDYSSTTCLGIGLTGPGNNVGSQPIVMYTRHADASTTSSSIFTDGVGNLALSPGTGGAILATGDLIGTASIGSVVIFANKSVRHMPFTFATLPSAELPIKGAEVYCSDCTFAPLCSAAGGSGHMAISNGLNWTCQ